MEFTVPLIILLLIFGFLSGMVATIAGIGGGVLFVTTLTLLLGMPINIAIDTSTFIILISSFAGFITYLRQKRTTIKITLLFTAFSLIGSILCTILLLLVPINNTILRIVFATLLIIAGANMMYKAYKSKKKSASEEDIVGDFSFTDFDYRSKIKNSIVFFIISGFSATLLGIGGGIINTPSLHIILGFPIHYATGISTSIIFFVAIYNTIVKGIIGQVDYIIGLIIAAGAVGGSILGAKVSKKMPKFALQLFIAILLILLAIRMYF